MSAHTTNYPIVSVLSGSVLAVSSFFQNHGYMVENIFELTKVICYGVIGGACGYIGKYLMERFLKKVKDKSKDICE